MSVFPTNACGRHDHLTRPQVKPANHCQSEQLRPTHHRPLSNIVFLVFSALLSRGWRLKVPAGQLTISSILLEWVMAAVTKHTILGMLATTEINGLWFCCRQLLWGKFSALMAAIAKGLILAFATRTPIVGFTCFNIYWVGCFLSNRWFHAFSFVKICFKWTSVVLVFSRSLAVNWLNAFCR